jgi:hypothetical protein
MYQLKGIKALAGKSMHSFALSVFVQWNWYKPKHTFLYYPNLKVFESNRSWQWKR